MRKGTKMTSQTSDVGPSSNVLLREFLSVIEPVDLLGVLQYDLGDALLKYREPKQDDEETIETDVNPLKVPRALYIVAVCTQLSYLIVLHGWGIAQKHGFLYLFNGFYWLRVVEDEFKKFLSTAAKYMGYYSPADAATPQFANAALKQFVLLADIPERSQDTTKALINLKNGTFDVEKQELREHRAEDFLTYCLDYNYNPNAQAPIFLKYLNRVLPNPSDQAVLQEFHGYIFTPLKLEKALILYGSGSNGKSVQFEITTALLGKHNIATKTLGDIMNGDMGNDVLGKLQNKLLNYGSEIRAKQVDADLLKRLISGEPVTYREKYKGSYDLENTCRFIFNANQLPQAAELTEAFFRRFLIIPYMEFIDDNEKDPELHCKIISNELPGILNWVISGTERLLVQKRFSYSESAHHTMIQYKHDSNVVSLFKEEYQLESSMHHKTPNAVLYQNFKLFCKEHGERSLSQKQFSQELKNLGFEAYRTSKERGFKVKVMQIPSHIKQLPRPEEKKTPNQKSWVQKLLKK